jgi:hypothetical protein
VWSEFTERQATRPVKIYGIVDRSVDKALVWSSGSVIGNALSRLSVPAKRTQVSLRFGLRIGPTRREAVPLKTEGSRDEKRAILVGPSVGEEFP